MVLQTGPQARLSPDSDARSRCREDSVPNTPRALRVPRDALRVVQRPINLPVRHEQPPWPLPESIRHRLLRRYLSIQRLPRLSHHTSANNLPSFGKEPVLFEADQVFIRAEATRIPGTCGFRQGGCT